MKKPLICSNECSLVLAFEKKQTLIPIIFQFNKSSNYNPNYSKKIYGASILSNLIIHIPKLLNFYSIKKKIQSGLSSKVDLILPFLLSQFIDINLGKKQ
jgi:hypothetical protein